MIEETYDSYIVKPKYSQPILSVCIASLAKVPFQTL